MRTAPINESAYELTQWSLYSEVDLRWEGAAVGGNQSEPVYPGHTLAPDGVSAAHSPTLTTIQTFVFDKSLHCCSFSENDKFTYVCNGNRNALMRGYAKNVDSQQIGSVPSPPPRFRGGHTCLWEKGLGKPNSYEGKYTVHGTLYTLYMHFCGSHCSKVCTTM
jgi:hypothetical protein